MSRHHVRFGSKADIAARPRNECSKLLYSITSSALASSGCGTVRPSAFAVTTRSNLQEIAAQQGSALSQY
jgi:hypothetical protein